MEVGIAIARLEKWHPGVEEMVKGLSECVEDNK